MKKWLMPLFLFIYIIKAGAQSPAPRLVHNMCYDSKNQQILLYGGGGQNVDGDLWAFKNNRWKKLADDGPPGRIKNAFTYDEERKCAVLFGGDNGKHLGDTWEWDGNTWKQVKIPGPSARLHCMAAYDAKNKQVILFGGVDSTGLLSDTWGYDGKMWTKLNSDGPKACLPHGIIYDEQKQEAIMITLSAESTPGSNPHKRNEMWKWTGKQWVKLTTQMLLTSPQGLQAVSSFGKGDIVLLDGDDVTGIIPKTWVFKNGEWKGMYIPGPLPRYGHAMVYNKAEKKLVLFGGSNRKENYNDTWEWDGKAWAEIK